MSKRKKTQGSESPRKQQADEKRNLKLTLQVRKAVVKAGGTLALAEALGIDNTTVWRWTLGITHPRSKLVLRALEEYLLS